MVAHTSWIGIAIGFAAVVACSSTETTSGPGGPGSTSGPGATGGGGATSTGGSGGAGGSMGGAGGAGGSMGGAAPGGGGSGGSADGGGGGTGGFPAILGDGVWLVGWSGGLDHFSWLRFTFQTPTSGVVDYLDAECPSCTGYFQCEGSGTFSADQLTPADDVTLVTPVACPGMHTLDFQSFGSPSGLFPSALLEAQVQEVGSMNPLMGAQFDALHCNPGFTTCMSPFQ
jgi:hypothetical protein